MVKLGYSLVITSFCAVIAPAFAQEVLAAGNFSHIVENLDRSIEFYRDGIGLEPPANVRPFDPNPAIMKMGNTLGAQSRVAVLRVPGFSMGLELIEYKDIDRRPARPRFQDPGTGNLSVRVKDMDAVVVRLKKIGAHFLTPGGVPTEIPGGARALFVADPDGFVVEVAQPKDTSGAAGGNVIGGGVEVTVADAEKAAAFYENTFGFTNNVDGSFNSSQLLTDTAGTPRAQFRHSRVQIPGGVTLNFIEFQNIDRRPLSTRVQDPGTALIQLRVNGLDALLKKVKASGGRIVSVGEVPVQVGAFGRIAIARDPNNLFLELIEPQGR
jgi:predicted enzyme related to lactoylglutathione lyase